MSNDNTKAKENVKVCNRTHNPGDDWDDDGCCQSTKATNEIIVNGAKNQQKKLLSQN
ncbi:hypothetical protein NIES4071_66250 [Calothrix sp. NIES-4071]|nr:hypothetical protein NIES4071_66250 [Calothrix sp. NIES-4071]BAZ60929.1 hypothetical protein NIES4105_66210 [Calothrix sp. NIES-4105]